MLRLMRSSLSTNDDQRDGWYLAVGRYIALFHQLEVHVHELAFALRIGRADGVDANETTDLPMRELIPLIEVLISVTALGDPGELEKYSKIRPTPYLERLVSGLAEVTSVWEDLVIGAWNPRHQSLSPPSPESQCDSDAEWIHSAWPLLRMKAAYQRLRDVNTDVLLTHALAQDPGRLIER